jgi:hemerythrin-like domain-containing protein
VRDLGNKGRKGALEMLERSHGKLQEALGELRSAANAIAAGSKSDADLAVIHDAVEFFERSVTRHEADEEQSLFPRLRGKAGIDPVLETLVDDHREHNRLHRRLREIAGTWGDSLPEPEHAQHLVRLVTELEDAYARHIALEDEKLFPAARALSAQELAAAAEEMQARRGR